MAVFHPPCICTNIVHDCSDCSRLVPPPSHSHTYLVVPPSHSHTYTWSHLPPTLIPTWSYLLPILIQYLPGPTFLPLSYLTGPTSLSLPFSYLPGPAFLTFSILHGVPFSHSHTYMVLTFSFLPPFWSHHFFVFPLSWHHFLNLNFSHYLPLSLPLLSPYPPPNVPIPLALMFIYTVILAILSPYRQTLPTLMCAYSLTYLTLPFSLLLSLCP